MRKAQITLFIIVGIFLLMLFGFAFYVMNLSVGEFLFKPVSTAPVKSYVESCLENSGRKSLNTLGLRGGYLKVPRDVGCLPIGDSEVTILYDKINKALPTLSEIENDLSFQVSKDFWSCLALEPFKEQGMDISTNESSVRVVVQKDRVLFFSDTTIIVKKGNQERELTGLMASVPIKFGLIYSLVNKTLQDITTSDLSADLSLERSLFPNLKNPPSFSIGFLFKIRTPEDVDVKFDFYDDDTTLWLIEDKSQNYKFIFATNHMKKNIFD